MSAHIYESLREKLAENNLVLEIPEPVGKTPQERGRGWCSRLIGAMAWFSSQAEHQYVWRGQGDAAWVIQPRLNRHVAVSLGLTGVRAIEDQEREILGHVRHQRWHLRDGQPLDALTLAAVLQHHGVPTRMLDVTRDPLVAGFFAAESVASGGSEADGAVVALRIPGGNVMCYKPDGESLAKALKFSPADVPYALWEPPSFDPRIITQRGAFLVPNVSRGGTGYAPTEVIGIGIDKPAGEYKGKIEAFFNGFLSKPSPGRPPTNPPWIAMIVVPGRMKSHLREYLGALGLTSHTMYPDLEGYANSFPPS